MAQEKKAAADKTHAVRDYLAQQGWPLSVVIDSGNGFQLVYRVDLPADCRYGGPGEGHHASPP